MRKVVIIWLAFIGISVNAQDEPKEIKKDSIKTETVEVITSYTPKVTDAEKIKRIPEIEFSRNIDKKKLDYEFKVKPVASTFIPKGVQMKVIKQEDKERIFKNYIKAGFGNKITPYVDVNVHENSAFDFEYGAQFQGIYSNNPIESNISSTYFNSNLDLFYIKETNYYDWELRSKISFDGYNWYGLPYEEMNFDKKALKVIDQNSLLTYNSYALMGRIDFDELYIETVKGNIGFFNDAYGNNEVNLGANALFIFPLNEWREYLESINFEVSLNSVLGGFKRGYDVVNQKNNHQFLDVIFHPYYEWEYGLFKTKVGFRTGIANDFANSKTKAYINPDVHVNMAFSENNLTSMYLGAKGGFVKNTFENLSRINPFMSPTHAILPTREKHNFYGGLKGIVGKFNYNLMAGYKVEENKPLFLANKSKSNGQETIDPTTRKIYKPYEYGNSFGLVYDDVKTISFDAELEYIVDGQLNLGFHGTFDKYMMTNQKEPWNLPQLKAELFAKFHDKKWFSGLNFYFVGSRNDVRYKTPTNVGEIKELKPYFSLNVDAGYHINEYLSVFVKGSNLTNSKYEQFSNYQAQGVLVIGGFIFRFDQINRIKTDDSTSKKKPF